MYVPFSSPLTHTLSRFFFGFQFPISAFFCSKSFSFFSRWFLFHYFRCFPSLFLFPLSFSLSLVFSFSISHREDRFHASRKTPPRGPRLFLPPKKGRVQPGRLYQVSPLSRECRGKSRIKKRKTRNPARPSREEAQSEGGDPSRFRN